MIRDITKKDYIYIFNLLNQLTSAPIIVEEEYNKIINNLSLHNKYIFLYTDDNDIPIGTISLLIESKLIHGGKCVGHIEDLEVDSKNTGKGIAKELIQYCINKAKNLNCYKIILDCTENLENFYIKNNFSKQGLCLRYNIA